MIEGAKRFVGPAILFLLTIAFYWKLALSDQYIWFDHSDMSYLELPRLQFQAREIHRGRFPLWDPYIWCGQSLIGQTQPGPLFPLNLLFFLLPLDSHGYVRNDFLNWYYVAVHALAALFCYCFCRELQLSRAASVLGGCGFGLGGFMGTVPWIDVMNGAIWTPLVLLYLLRAVKGTRPAANAALSGLFLGIAWLSGHHELPLMLSVFAAGSWIWFAWPKRRLFRYAALSFGIAALVAAVQLWPTYEFAHLSKRWVGAEHDEIGWNRRVPYTSHTMYSLPASGVVETVLPTSHTYADISPFLGGVAVSLAILGLAANWNTRLARWLAVAGALSLVYALGAATPLHGTIYAISPMMARARVPVRAILFVDFVLAVMAAYGLHALQARTGSDWARRIGLWMAGLSAAMLALASILLYTGPAAPDRVWLTALCLAAGAGVVYAWHGNRLDGRICAIVLVGLVLTELTPFATAFPHLTEGNQLKYASALFRNRDIADFLRAQPDRIRVVVNEKDVPENFGDWHAIEMLQGYVAGAPSNLVDGYMHTDRFRQLVGVTHYVGKESQRPGQVPVFYGASAVKVFRNPGAMPRVWTVHEAVSVKTSADASAHLQDLAVDLRKTVAVIGPAPQLESCDGDQAEVVRHGASRVTIRVKMACRGMVILGDSYYPGWRAKVDRRPVPIHAAFGVVRAMVVEAGEHEIDMRYLPTSFIGGAGLTLIGLCATLVIVWRSRVVPTAVPRLP
jgi:hypothetical protein